jgi:hypothetical protein
MLTKVPAGIGLAFTGLFRDVALQGLTRVDVTFSEDFEDFLAINSIWDLLHFWLMITSVKQKRYQII